MAQRAVDRRFGPGEKPDEAHFADARRDALEPRWPIRRRFLFIVTAAAVCWIVPAVIAYLLLARP